MQEKLTTEDNDDDFCLLFVVRATSKHVISTFRLESCGKKAILSDREIVDSEELIEALIERRTHQD